MKKFQIAFLALGLVTGVASVAATKNSTKVLAPCSQNDINSNICTPSDINFCCTASETVTFAGETFLEGQRVQGTFVG